MSKNSKMSLDDMAVRNAIRGALDSLGLQELFKEKEKMDEYRRVSSMPDEVKQKEVHRVDFNPVGEKISIVPIHDIHYGAYNCNKDKFKAFIDYILNTEDTYTIGLGDLIENATKTSVGMGVYEEEVHIDEQIEHMTNLLEPLARAGKLLGLMPGNHEYRTSVLIKMDPMKLIAKHLSRVTGIEIPFLGYQGFHKWVIGDQIYKAHTFHGRASAGTPGGRINAVRKQNNIMLDADIYFMGHVHAIQDDSDQGFIIDDSTDTLISRRRHYVIGGSLLSYFDGYAEMMGLVPSPQGLVRIDLYKNEKRIVIHKP